MMRNRSVMTKMSRKDEEQDFCWRRTETIEEQDITDKEVLTKKMMKGNRKDGTEQF